MTPLKALTKDAHTYYVPTPARVSLFAQSTLLPDPQSNIPPISALEADCQQL